MSDCKHYQGFYHNDACKLGIKYKDVIPHFDRPGAFYRKPCQVVDTPCGLATLKEHGPQGTCPMHESYTPAELAQQKQDVVVELEKLVSRMETFLPLMAKIKKEQKGRNWSGVLDCPACDGVLHVSHSGYNGHLALACETDNCIRVME